MEERPGVLGCSPAKQVCPSGMQLPRHSAVERTSTEMTCRSSSTAAGPCRAYVDRLTLTHTLGSGEEGAAVFHLTSTHTHTHTTALRQHVVVVRLAHHNTKLLLVSSWRTALYLHPLQQGDAMNAAARGGHYCGLVREPQGKLASVRGIPWVLHGKDLQPQLQYVKHKGGISIRTRWTTLHCTTVYVLPSVGRRRWLFIYSFMGIYGLKKKT